MSDAQERLVVYLVIVGIFLALTATIVLFWGDEIVAWYRNEGAGPLPKGPGVTPGNWGRFPITERQNLILVQLRAFQAVPERHIGRHIVS